MTQHADTAILEAAAAVTIRHVVAQYEPLGWPATSWLDPNDGIYISLGSGAEVVISGRGDIITTGSIPPVTTQLVLAFQQGLEAALKAKWREYAEQPH